MRIVIFMALLGGIASVGLAYAGARRSAGRRDWLPGALRSLAAAREPHDVVVLLKRHLEIGLGATRVEWWQRDETGVYRSVSGDITGADANILDQWVLRGVAWRGDDEVSVDAAEADVLRATATELVVPLRAGGRSVGLLGLGTRTDHRRYRDSEVAAVAALADHLAVVADRVQLAAALEESRRIVQQATRLSTVGTLAAELAHEIRNPLVAVQTFLQILPERLDDPEVTGDLRAVALTELQRVARLLNELLGMARASVATFSATDLEAVVEQVVRLLQVSARKKDVTLVRTGEPLPTGAADASRLKQALVNLVLNAIQASPAGTTVTVTTATNRDGGRPLVEVAISDQGPGIPVEARESIFHPFFTTKDNGTGLGLPVTRQIISDHGGALAVEGADGEGATFVIRLPLTAAPHERREKSPTVRAA